MEIRPILVARCRKIFHGVDFYLVQFLRTSFLLKLNHGELVEEASGAMYQGRRLIRLKLHRIVRGRYVVVLTDNLRRAVSISARRSTHVGIVGSYILQQQKRERKVGF